MQNSTGYEPNLDEGAELPELDASATMRGGEALPAVPEDDSFLEAFAQDLASPSRAPGAGGHATPPRREGPPEAPTGTANSEDADLDEQTRRVIAIVKEMMRDDHRTGENRLKFP